MSRPRTSSVASLLAAAVLFSGVAIAQRDANAVQPAQPAFEPMNLEWPGGTLADYVERVLKATGSNPLNVVVDPAVESWPVAPVTLRQVSPSAAIELLEWATQVPETHRFSVGLASRGRDNSAPVMVLRAERLPTGALQHMPAQVQVLPIRPLIEPGPGESSSMVYKSDVVLSALEAALQMADQDGQPATVRFHPDSGLLLVKGDHGELNSAVRTVDLLSADLEERRRRFAAEPSKELSQRLSKIAEASRGDLELELVDLRAELTITQANVQQARVEAQRIEEELPRLKQLADRGMVSDSQIRDAEVALQRARLAVETAIAQESRVKQRLDILSQRAGGEGSRDYLIAQLRRAELDQAESAQQAAALEERLQQMRSRVNVDVSRKDLDAAERELAAAKERAVAAQAVVVELRRRVEMLGPDPAQESAEEISRLHRELEAMSRAKTVLEVRHEELMRLLRSYEERVGRLQDELERTRAELVTLQVRLKDGN